MNRRRFLDGTLSIVGTTICLWAGVGCASASAQRTIKLIEKPASAGSPTNDAATPEAKNVALVMKTLTNPYFVEMEKGARQAEKELGVHLIVKTAAQETSIEQQIGIVEDLVRARVDAIVIAPGDSIELIPALKKAQDAGIVVVNVDNQIDGDSAKRLGMKPVPFVSVDNEHGAYLAVKRLVADLKAPVKVALLEGIRGAKNAEDRKNGALKAFRERSDIKVVAQDTANWKIDEAHDVAQKMFESAPDIGAVYCANDMMALGVISYLDGANRKDVLVGGFDALAEAKAALRSGKMVVTVDQQAALQGYTGVSYAVKSLAGEAAPMVTLVDVLVVDATSLAVHG